MDAITSLLVPIHREGTRFIIAFAIATLILFLIWAPLGWLGVLLTAWCVYFFRDPDRLTPQRAGLVIAPADGVVNMITEAAPPAELGLGETPRPRISIFMNVFNCHVNRIPIAGRVTRTAYRPGKFLNADLDKASDENERAAIAIETEDGKTFVAVQIAGLVARRIVSDAVEGQSYETGERYGIIRFGSRVDVYLEPGMSPLVSVGQTAIAGETVLADTDSSEGRREALVR
ncbi:phosphatidylserine decarboxylase-like protein [Tepidicaulis marinus]|jgi:phosphatidylserine decarboxylase|uniref:Phosphatidylserine decarboxylase proenzyme n=1 Tax=Tepidicaulis marinus TaxID=1333998 RepID=A0A081BCR5_9HYPH|nr:phosphatidylserine decarboxylase [Tepidicaulis marinus]GAK45833.1 phosphatidylserine decarboxylase-like protein [Tepidicaulis marinus]